MSYSSLSLAIGRDVDFKPSVSKHSLNKVTLTYKQFVDDKEIVHAFTLICCGIVRDDMVRYIIIPSFCRQGLYWFSSFPYEILSRSSYYSFLKFSRKYDHPIQFGAFLYLLLIIFLLSDHLFTHSQNCN